VHQLGGVGPRPRPTRPRPQLLKFTLLHINSRKLGRTARTGTRPRLKKGKAPGFKGFEKG
jgi:hypothetical protein